MLSRWRKGALPLAVNIDFADLLQAHGVKPNSTGSFETLDRVSPYSASFTRHLDFFLYLLTDRFSAPILSHYSALALANAFLLAQGRFSSGSFYQLRRPSTSAWCETQLNSPCHYR